MFKSTIQCFGAVLLSAISLAAISCNSNKQGPAGSTTPATRAPGSSDPIDIVATVGMVADIVHVVGGEQVAITQICGSGVDPHLYKPNRDDVQSIHSADVVFYCGLMLEGKMTSTLEKVGKKKPVVAVAEKLDPTTLLKPDEFEGHFDPHVWNDVSAWSQCVDVVAETLAEFDPDNKEDYLIRASEYRERLGELHEYGVKSIGSIPAENRVLITSHDAFNYFGRAYNLEVLGVQGLSTESEAGLQRVNELVDLLVTRNVKAVFIESSVSRKNIDALIEGAKSRDHNVIVGGELFSDAMGKDGTYEGTYVGMLDHNITTVATSLGGDADPKGFGGKLAHHEHSGEPAGTDAPPE